MAFLCAYFWPNFEDVLQLMGSMMALLIFFFPGIATVVTFANTRDKFSTVLALLGAAFAVFGTYLFFYSFTTTLLKMIS